MACDRTKERKKEAMCSRRLWSPWWKLYVGFRRCFRKDPISYSLLTEMEEEAFLRSRR